MTCPLLLQNKISYYKLNVLLNLTLIGYICGLYPLDILLAIDTRGNFLILHLILVYIINKIKLI